MPGNLLSVESDNRFIVRRTEIHEGASVWFRLPVEYISVPDRALIIVELIPLSIPVTRHHQGVVSIEIVLIEDSAVGIEVSVREIRACIRVRLHPVIVISVFIRIDNGFPKTVQGNCLSSENIHYLRSRRIFTGICCGRQQYCGNDCDDSFHTNSAYYVKRYPWINPRIPVNVSEYIKDRAS